MKNFNLENFLILMGPLLFLIYVNDISCASSFQTTLYADDTSLHLSHRDRAFLVVRQILKKLSSKLE